MTSASSACAMSRPSKVASSVERRPQPGVVQRRELRHAGVEQEALEPDDARLVQRAQLVEVARDGAAPEGDVGRDLALRRLRVSRATPRRVVVGGMELRGMSTMVVIPPATAARVAVAKPSHSVRPGSLTCTWLSTRPGSSTSSSARVTAPAGASSNAVTAVIRPPSVCTAAARSPSGSSTRRARTTSLTREPARRSAGRAPPPPAARDAARFPRPWSPSRPGAAAGRERRYRPRRRGCDRSRRRDRTRASLLVCATWKCEPTSTGRSPGFVTSNSIRGTPGSVSMTPTAGMTSPSNCTGW